MSVRMTVDTMPPEMLGMRLPCTEIDCWETSNWQLRFDVGDAVYLVAVCADHAANANKEND
jgi:hypothetical protein